MTLVSSLQSQTRQRWLKLFVWPANSKFPSSSAPLKFTSKKPCSTGSRQVPSSQFVRTKSNRTTSTITLTLVRIGVNNPAAAGKITEIAVQMRKISQLAIKVHNTKIRQVSNSNGRKKEVESLSKLINNRSNRPKIWGTLKLYSWGIALRLICKAWCSCPTVAFSSWTMNSTVRLSSSL